MERTPDHSHSRASDAGEPRTLARRAWDPRTGCLDVSRELCLQQARLEAVVSERERLARELHDSAAQVLAATQLRLQVLLGRPEVASLPGVAEELAELAGLCREGARECREAIHGLRGAADAHPDLVERLTAYASAFERRSGLTTTVEAGDQIGDLPAESLAQVVRVVQEALTNVRKHAAARTARLVIGAGRDGVWVEVSDDGRGFTPGSLGLDQEGYGITAMHERAALAGGRLTVESAPGQGTRVRVDVPRRPPGATAVAEPGRVIA